MTGSRKVTVKSDPKKRQKSDDSRKVILKKNF